MTRSIREKWLEDGMKMLTLDIKDKTEEIERLREIEKGARAIIRHYIDPGHNMEDGCWNRFAAVVDEKP